LLFQMRLKPYIRRRRWLYDINEWCLGKAN
jgi:hypothetical protein